MFKKILSLTLAAVMVMGMGSTASAAEPTMVSSEIQKLSEKYDFETFDLNNTAKSATISDKMIFDTVEDFEEFVKTSQEVKHFEEAIQVSEMENPLLRADTQDSHVINWWAPFSGWGMTGLACWRNISFEYTYKHVNGKPQYTSVSNIDSYLNGINITWWNQKTKSYNIKTEVSTKDKVVINVKGNYVLGVEVEGFEIGVTIPDEWEGSLRLY